MAARDTLTREIELRLGGGMIDVELDPDHYNLAITKSLEKYRQRSSQSTEESFVLMELKIDVSEYTLADEVIEVKDFPEARKPSYKLKIDFGEGVGIKKSSAQITTHYSIESLIGRKVLAVVNFPPRQIGKFMSEVLVMGLADENENIVLFNLDKEVPNGARLL